MLVRLFGAPIGVAFGTSAFMVTLTAAGGLLGRLATSETIWHEPWILSAFILVGSQIGPRIAMRSKPVAMRTRFATYLFGIACQVIASLFIDTSGEEMVQVSFD